MIQQSWCRACAERLTKRLSKVHSWCLVIAFVTYYSLNLCTYTSAYSVVIDSLLQLSVTLTYPKKITSCHFMQVSLKVQLHALGFCKSHDPPEVLMKIMLDTAVDAFAKCNVSHNVQMVHVLQEL